MNNFCLSRWLRRLPLVLPELLVSLSACAPITVTPITTVNTDEHHPGRFVWHDLLTSDVEAAKQFYGGVFGWTFEEHGPYTVVSNHGVPIAGMAKPKFKPGLSSFWLPYLSVDSIDSALATAKQAGAEVLKGPGELVNRGDYVLIGDPQGARLVLLNSSSGDPTDFRPAVNGWLWNELWSADMGQSLAFYQQLVGYNTLPTPAGAGSDYEVLTIRKTWAAGLTTLPFEGMNSQWVPAIRVADLDQTVARVEEHGGRVVIKPDHSLSKHRIAMIQDPTGAILLIGPGDGGNSDRQQEAN